MTKALHDFSIAEAGKLLRSGTVTSMALTEHAFERIKTIDPLIYSFVTLTRESALAEAADGRCRLCQRHRQGADAGHSACAEGHLRHRRHPHDLPLEAAARQRADRGFSRRREIQGAGRGDARQARDPRIRHRRAVVRPAVPAGAQSVEPGSHSGRLVVRIGRGGRRRARAHGDGVGHRRFDPRARRLLRHGRAEADLRPRLAPRRVSRCPTRSITAGRCHGPSRTAPSPWR